MMRLRVLHRTTYAYDEPVTTSHHELHLTPREAPGQSCLAHAVAVQPAPPSLRERLDFFGNRTLYFGIHESHRSLEIRAESDVRVEERSSSLLLDRTSWEDVRDRVSRDRRPEIVDAFSFVFDSPYVPADPALADLARLSFTPRRALLDAVRDLTRRVHSEFCFDPRATRVSTPLSDVLRDRRGVCQDFAHVAIGCLRAVGLPARYVSGYLLTTPPPGAPRLVGCDASHAWVSTYLPDVGWIDFDPSNDMMPDERHVIVAHGRDYGDVAPVRGVILGGGRPSLAVAVDVVAVEEGDPRPR